MRLDRNEMDRGPGASTCGPSTPLGEDTSTRRPPSEMEQNHVLRVEDCLLFCVVS